MFDCSAPEAELQHAAGAAHTSSGSSSSTVQMLLYQIWDLVESPNFQAVYIESIDSCFRIMFGHLRQAIFLPAEATAGASSAPANADSPAGRGLRTPPLASLLPQVKSVALNLLPAGLQLMEAEDVGGRASDSIVTPEVKEIASGPFLEAFCIAIFDAP